VGLILNLHMCSSWNAHVCIDMYVYVYIYIYVYMYICIYIYIHIYIYMCVCVLYQYMYTYIHLCVYYTYILFVEYNNLGGLLHDIADHVLQYVAACSAVSVAMCVAVCRGSILHMRMSCSWNATILGVLQMMMLV